MDPVKVMINGLPGNMAQVVTKQVINDERFELIPHSLTGPEITNTEVTIDNAAIRLVQPEARATAIEEIKAAATGFISVDYTHPTAVNGNAEFYCSSGLPFVMGTTGGDRELLDSAVKSSAIAAVIAPNMAKQIVGFQAMMAYAAENFPNLFQGYSLEVRESHQKGKADTSGTAKAMVGYFNLLGTPYSEADIVMERDPERQQSLWGIPEAYLQGHGWHTYSLTSADQTVHFEFSHNVNGREIYAGGTLDAIVYLHGKLQAGAKGKVYSMIDVLKNA